MVEPIICTDTNLEDARRLVEQMEAGNNEAALDLLSSLTASRESSLFQELGKLTRDLHDTLAGFQLDSKIAAMAETDIPDAKERLNHVITMTEQAADRTLNAVEASLPIADELQSRSTLLKDQWERFRSRDLSADEFRELSRELDGLFAWMDSSVPQLSSNLSEVMMAQDYQDLTGQIIRRVINLVQEVEGSLVDLVRITGQQMQTQTEPSKKVEKDIKAVGPVVPGVDTGDLVSGQDDVDDLLSSLGF